MKQNKSLLPATSLIVVIISVLAVYCSGNEKSAKPPGASKPSSNDTFQVRPLTNITYEPTPSRLERGEYLTTGLLQCFTCHSPRNWTEPGAPPIAEKKGSGGTILIDDSTSFIIAPNITPDKETGAGTWTDDMLARAIREGVGHDGRALYWQMPSTSFRNLSDEDLASVIVYLRSIPAVHNLVRSVKMPAAQRSEIERSLRPLTEPVEMPDLSDSLKRGKYLARLGECAGCHNDGDLKSIYAYLRTFPAAKHLISNQAPFTHCAICEQDHGLGDKNKREKPAGIKIDPDIYELYAGTYLNERYNWPVTVTREKNNLIFQPWENGPKIELVPQSALHFLAPGWVLPLSFVKDGNGHIAQLIEDSDEGLTYKKIK